MKEPIKAPAYAALYPQLCEVARANGYALAIHGTLARDMDLIACPWSPQAESAEKLVADIWKACQWLHNREFENEEKYRPEEKAHGRRAWTIPLMSGAAIDLSVMPKIE